jgi:2'-5' RNA ligase
MAATRWQAAQTWPAHARLTAPSKLHLTLPFIGAVSLPRVPDLLQACALPFTAFDLQLDQVEHWPHGLIVLTPSQTPGALVDLHQRLAERVEGLGFPLEQRPYRPHLTLARHAEGFGLDEGTHPVPAVAWHAKAYVMAHSVAGRYDVLRRYPSSTPAGSSSPEI